MNTINNIASLSQALPLYNYKDTTSEQTTLFESFLDAAMKVYDQTSENILKTEQMYIDLATGKTDDILAVVLSQQKAEASLSFTVQVTGRILEAYREIMRMQI